MPSAQLQPHVLLVSTDEVLTYKASQDLQEAGYQPLFVGDMAQVWPELGRLQPALMVIDRLRAGPEGLLLCRELRRQHYPITLLMVVEQETVEERAACLEAGADDYLLKPYRAESFLQRIHFYLSPSETALEQLQFSNLTLDLTSRRLFLSGRVVELTMKEFELLKYLMTHAKEVVTREQILEHVWGYDFQGESNIIEVYIRYLRLKLEQNGQKRFIHTVRGVGYVLRDN